MLQLVRIDCNNHENAAVPDNGGKVYLNFVATQRHFST